MIVSITCQVLRRLARVITENTALVLDGYNHLAVASTILTIDLPPYAHYCDPSTIGHLSDRYLELGLGVAAGND